MELNTEDQTPAQEAAEAAPVRRRASRRVSAAAGAAPEVAADTAATAAAPAAAPEAAPAEQAAPAEAPAEKAAPKRASRARKKAEPEAPAAEADEAAAAPKTTRAAAKAKAEEAPAKADEAVAKADDAEAAPAEAPKKRATRSRKAAAAAEAPAEDAAAEQPAAAGDAQAAATPAEEPEAAPAKRSRRRSSQTAEQAEGETPAQSEEPKGRGRGNQNGAKGDAAKNDGSKNDGSKGDAAKGDADKQGQSDKQGQEKQGQGDRSDNSKQENGSRSSRTRQRDRKRRGGDDLEPEIAEDDVLLPVAGILDVLDNYAFVRTSGYLPGVSDVYVALGQVKKYSLRRGDAIVGAIRQPREGDSGGRQKYNAIVKIDSVNGKPVEETEKRADIAEMTAIFPEQPLRFATGEQGLGSAIDAAAPMGLGQRALIALPAEIPAARVFAELAAAVTANAPDAHLLLVLTNARPEEVTHLQRTVSGEVIAATFDRAAEDQATIVELALDRASRLVELGHDVIVLLDSLTDLAHATQQNLQGSRTTPEAAQALPIAHAKRLLGAARNLENGGSLTLLATARTHTGVAGDKDLLRALVPAVNSFVKISGSRQAPEVNAEKSYTLSF
ncbi:hypothetical protein [Leucobacter aridicollis]|uniref:hypothetical protein n=1 Tax=Leucobacter aridicollis TaxID=283878 RepID=UPI0021694195|nr:hypothetical protein [Leucobacter aridicollis]MCS3427627.1 transcription termination factor Rho [Leucobacter aridicollis]